MARKRPTVATPTSPTSALEQSGQLPQVDYICAANIDEQGKTRLRLVDLLRNFVSRPIGQHKGAGGVED